MRTLLGAMRHGNRGEPLPPIFTEFVQHDVRIRLGELTMIAAAPGGCKTILALTLALRCRLPTLYFSPDTSVADVSSRLISMAKRELLTSVQEHLCNGGRHFYDDLIRQQLSHIRWDFTTSLTVKGIEENLEAFALLTGDYPHLVVIDCLKNMGIGGEDEQSDRRGAMEYLASMAKGTGSAVIVLHHLTGHYDAGLPPDLAAIKGKVSEESSLILGLHAIHDSFMGQERLCVSILKDRAGKADPAGKHRVYLPMNRAIMSLG